MKNDGVVKPPIGLKPKFVKRLERLNEIKEAVDRYYCAKVKIPIEWIEEYNEELEQIDRMTGRDSRDNKIES